MAETPILPAHIEDTIQAIAKLHASHHAETGSLQRSLDRTTDWLGQPRSIALMTMLAALWVAGNCVALARGDRPWDVPPFGWLQTVLGSMAFFVALIILATQRRADHLRAPGTTHSRAGDSLRTEIGEDYFPA